jgi:hypothetical protein
MAEVQKQNPAQAGEMAQRFVQFVLMQAQQVMFMLGAPTPEGDSIPPNLETARMFIDQLEMIHVKTTGNLSAQESAILEDTLTKLRLAYVRVSGDVGAFANSPKFNSGAAPAPVKEPAPARPETAKSESADSGEEPENKKRFTKSYG